MTFVERQPPARTAESRSAARDRGPASPAAIAASRNPAPQPSFFPVEKNQPPETDVSRTATPAQRAAAESAATARNASAPEVSTAALSHFAAPSRPAATGKA